MSRAAFTPGPWTRDKYGHIIAPDGEDVRFRSLTIAASGTPERIAQAEANTDLAAAAPDLLEALVYLRECIELGREPGMGVVNRAISKATGGAA